LPSDPYDDPRMQQGDRVKFEQIGDRIKGVVVNVEVVSNANGNSYHYKMGESVVSQLGRQSRRDSTEFFAGTANLVGQLNVKRPRPGDVLDIVLKELRPNPGRSDTKFYDVEVTPYQAGGQSPQAPPEPPPPPPAPPGPQPTYPPPNQPQPAAQRQYGEEEDLFA
jgi:hypothetical protein